MTPKLVTSGPHQAYFGELILVDPSGGPITILLPDKLAARGLSTDVHGHELVIKETSGSSTTITIAAPAGFTIDGSPSITSSVAKASVQIMWSGGQFWVI